eukprot:TRINITY_DN18527_c0_g1_i2.p1 TRINITY_DN18527_c0_g1~~TRINITY_DN18527_c0_g1_i2.p1  ORF type:complete len:670 (-),score=89.44 TRINITY_DN18527_c0_g1_i2:163-2172(-)
MLIIRCIRLCGVCAVLLTVVERPPWCKVNDMCDDPLYPSYHLNLFDSSQQFYLELVIIVPFAFDVFCCIVSQGGEFWTVTRQLMRCSLVVSYAACMLYSSLAPVSWFRLAPFLRIFLFVDYSHHTRHAYKLKLITIPQILSYLVLGCTFILFFAWIGILLFPVDTEEGKQFFHGLFPSMWSLFVLITTANFPDVMMPAYRENRAAFLFFASFVLLGIWFLLNVITATIFNTYSLQKEKAQKHRVRRHARFLREAYSAMKLDDDKIAPETFRAVLLALNEYPDIAYISRKDADMILAKLDTNLDGQIEWEEFRNVTTVLTQKFRTEPLPPMLERMFPRLLTYAPWLGFKAFIKSRLFDWIVDIVLVITTVVMIQENMAAILGAKHAEKQWLNEREWNVVELSLCVFFSAEAILKIVVYGWNGYIGDVKNAFDFMVTVLTDVVTLIILLPNEYSNYNIIKIVAAFRLLRIVRLLLVVERYRVIMATFVAMMPMAATVFKSALCTMYLFGVLGVQLFGGVINKDPDSAYFESVKDTDFAAAGYWENNFNDMPSALVTLFELIVVNNWFVISDGFSAACGPWARAYFVAFYVCGFLITFNIVLAYTLDTYSTEYAKNDTHGPSTALNDASQEEEGAEPAQELRTPVGNVTTARVAALEAFVRKHGVDPATITG